ncbi:MAG: cytochrome b [Pseudomonadota bacterium]|uniref:cytochrome b n=1 Tax=Thermithiobacillus tepidarius TaxID=929 RepID=UPI001E4E5B62|nr:cytochrome b N-terminal domain-containing protein [Thermithiobacillus tepidarius]
MKWIDERFPLTSSIKAHMTEYYAPKNFNIWYYFGSLAMLVLVIQILSGIFLTMNYKPDAAKAFDSIQYIMYDVDYGWLMRYLHSTGASMFFVVVYLHMMRGLMYGSFKKPRELIWIFGMLIYVVLMAEAFLGYVLPFGNMSLWGAQVIISLFGAIPGIGEPLAEWIRGGPVVADPTVNRFLALHVVAVPLVLIGLIVAHLIALHEVGSNNPDGVEIKKNKGADGHPVDGIPFHPYYTVKDIFGVGVFLIVFAAIIFYAPTMGGVFLEHDNYFPADPVQTPPEIKPLWYLTPFYAMLRAVPDKLMGVIVMALSLLILFFMPWLDRSPVKSVRHRPIYRIMLIVFAITFVVLGYLGMNPPSPTYTMLARVFTVIYFLFFLALPFVSKIERTKPVPERVTM